MNYEYSNPSLLLLRLYLSNPPKVETKGRQRYNQRMDGNEKRRADARGLRLQNGWGDLLHVMCVIGKVVVALLTLL